MRASIHVFLLLENTFKDTVTQKYKLDVKWKFFWKALFSKVDLTGIIRYSIKL